ncbi:Rap1a/Tai family immunity protein [Granulicella mallensis]|uniref:Rap1a immunity protein domain-containing protein n=1 Tax=Granulicella mallensis TaxID=940614 RepID=A0A7W7ZVQ8_9BACT|nr:Rap1a/Tai family immunity protein [Granulicella mallensis]MBB5066131.1 hypothetical protein [Granulicella mallensis]
MADMLAPMLAIALFAVDRPFTTGTDLVHECKNYIAMLDNTRNLDSVDLYDAGACYGYIDGITAGLTSMRVACPTDAALGTLVRVYLVYMEKHPKTLDFAASAGVYGALQEAYPCPVKK